MPLSPDCRNLFQHLSRRLFAISGCVVIDTCGLNMYWHRNIPVVSYQIKLQ
jgi:hypothetical protein